MNRQVISISTVNNYDLDELKNIFIKMFSNLGFSKKNPFENLVKPGDRVFIKPNWVASSWRKSCDHVDNLYSVITHPSIIETVADYVALALKGKGEIIIGDNPSIDANFEELMEYTKIKRIENKYDVKCTILDLRPLICDNLKNYGRLDAMKQQQGDPLGGTTVNLGNNSLLFGIDPSKFRGVFDDRTETIESHKENVQLYTYSKTLYESDVYISIPKLKTHHKVGATLNLKGLVGSIIKKNQLVHWKIGYPEIGGDEYPNYNSYKNSINQKVTHRGAWYGNDTIWRMVVDLYLGMQKRERKYFSVIDGVIGGEGQGPFCPNSKKSNTIIMGTDLVNVDIVACRYMGFNPNKIKYLAYFIEKNPLMLENMDVIIDDECKDDFFYKDDAYLNFNVEKSWEYIKYIN